MTASIDFDIFKQELARAIRELQHASSTVDLQLLEELRIDDEDRDESSYRTLVVTRQRNLLVAQARLSRALHDTQQYWDSVLRSTDQLGDEDQRRNLYEQALHHWQSQGGDQVQREAKNLADQIDVALQLLPQAYTPQLPQAADRQPMTPTQPQQRRSGLMTPATSTAINQNPDDNYSRDGKLNAVEHLPQTLPHAQACSDEEIRQGQHEPLPQEQFVRLPKFDLPMFAGDIDRFPEFWDAFNSAVHANPTISPVVKFHHLRNLLKGDAQAVVAGYDITQSNYELAIKTLQETYYRPQLIRTQLSVKLQTMRPASMSPLHQRTTLAQIRSLWLQLEKLGDHEDNIFVMRLIRQKFPQRTLEHLGTIETADPTPWKVPQLLAGLDRAIKTFETIADTAEQPQVNTHALAIEARSPSRDRERFSRHRSRTRTPTPTRRTARPRTRQACAFCKRFGHATADCHLVTTQEARRAVVSEEQLCRKCLRSGHTASQCDRPPCRFCRYNHHETLCPQYRAPIRNSDKTYRSTSGSRAASSHHSRYRSTSRSPSAHTRRSTREVTFREPRRSSRRMPSPYPRRSRSSSRESRHNVVIADPFPSQYHPQSEESEDTDDEDCDKYHYSLVNLSTSSSSDPRLMVTTSRTVNQHTGLDEILVLMLDSGAQQSFIRENTARRLGLPLKDPCSFTTRSFGGHFTVDTSYFVKITLYDQANEPMPLRLRTHQVTTSIRANDHINPRELGILRDMYPRTLRSSTAAGEVEIDILVGIDHYWSILDPSRIQKLPSGMTIAHTRFGSILSGQPRRIIIPTISCLNTVTKVESHRVQPDLSKLWDLESLGIHENPSMQHDDETNRQVIKQFYDTVQVLDGIIHVQFPWKQNHPRLPDNKLLALRRLQSQYQSLNNNSQFWSEYCAIFDRQIIAGVMEDVQEFVFDGPEVYYMPHQAVIKTDSTTTALRIVFDASSHLKGQPSLNDCLHQGPPMLPDLAGALLRARLSRYLLIADVEKAFHQIRLQKDQRDATRLLWLKDTSRPPTQDNLRFLRFTRVVFGINVSPFLLNISIKYALERDSQNSIRDEVLANTYVDNVLIGANCTDECIRKQKDCKQTFARMAMNLREFMCNNPRVMESIPEDDRMKVRHGIVKLLGIRWNPQQDILHVTAKFLRSATTTKRTVLQALASNFDPLGFLSPLFIQLKIFLQDLWKGGQEWDQPLADQDKTRWQQLVREIEGYTCSLPRFITYGDEPSEYELLLFADASKRAYSAVAYLLSKKKNRPQSHLLMAKTRVAPLNEVTIPRLELMACCNAASLAQFLYYQLKLTITTIRFFSDSHIALYWIHSTRPLKTFVMNRVKKIRTVIDEFASLKINTTFHYVNTEANPADCATRGLSAREISGHIWWTGPPYILLPPAEWPDTGIDFTAQPLSAPETELEYKTVAATSTSVYKSILPFNRINDYNKFLRITAYILHFICKAVYKKISFDKRKRLHEEMLLAELYLSSKVSQRHIYVAELVVSREHQRESPLSITKDTYRDSFGIIRVNTRMRREMTPILQEHPILLDSTHSLTAMIITSKHQQLHHAGAAHVIATLRSHFFIRRMRRTVQSVLSRCVVCKRHQGRPYSYPTAPDLPTERLTRSRPFQNTGIDYFGPMQVTQNEKEIRKVWICLFTCMATRALHLELVHNNTAHEFLLAFRRFIARRGTPNLLVSDNAPTFKLGHQVIANDLLVIAQHSTVTNFTTKNSLQWNFITPLSPWKGGFYERLVGIVKKALYKTVHRNVPDIRILETLIIEIEATLNTRPLTPVRSTIPLQYSMLRPIDLISPHFHLGTFTSSNLSRDPSFYAYDLKDSQTREALKEHHNALITTLDHFWKLWSEDYLQSLAQRQQNAFNKSLGSASSPVVGDIVLVKTEDMPRAFWPLAIITRLNTSTDGSVRSVQLRTVKNTSIDRSIKHLIPLELHVSDETMATPPAKPTPARIQPPRQVKRAASR